jgi:hypothetical protein
MFHKDAFHLIKKKHPHFVGKIEKKALGFIEEKPPIESGSNFPQSRFGGF